MIRSFSIFHLSTFFLSFLSLALLSLSLPSLSPSLFLFSPSLSLSLFPFLLRDTNLETVSPCGMVRSCVRLCVLRPVSRKFVNSSGGGFFSNLVLSKIEICQSVKAPKNVSRIGKVRF